MHDPRLLRSAICLVLFLILASAVPASTPEEQLWQAAREGDTSRVRTLLEKGAPVDAKTEFDCTALYFAANSNRPEVLKLLIETGADVDVRDNSYGFAAISMAAWLGHAEAVEVLIDGGAATGDATGAIFAAAGNGHEGVVRILLDKLELEQAQLDAVLATALQSDHAEVVELLKRAGAKGPDTASTDAHPASDGSADARTAQTGEGREPTATEEMSRPDGPALGQPVRVEKARPWPEFRGVGRTGIADGQHPPLTWDLKLPRIRGDITPEESGGNDHVLWSSQTNGAYSVTPLLYRGLLYVCRGNGALTAYDAATGEQIYRHRLKGSYTASPVAADGRIYFTSEDGEVIVIQAGRTFRVLAENELGAASLATPAISDGILVLRTVVGLVGVGAPTPTAR